MMLGAIGLCSLIALYVIYRYQSRLCKTLLHCGYHHCMLVSDQFRYCFAPYQLLKRCGIKGPIPVPVVGNHLIFKMVRYKTTTQTVRQVEFSCVTLETSHAHTVVFNNRLL